MVHFHKHFYKQKGMSQAKRQKGVPETGLFKNGKKTFKLICTEKIAVIP